MMSPETPLRILYIAGFGRCGSTLLARVLGELDGVANIGEATRCLLHSRMFERLDQCGCGQTIHHCDFWEGLLQAVPDEHREVATRVVRTRNMLLGSRDFRSHGDLEGVKSTLERLLQGVQERSGCHSIVDASKNPALAKILVSVPAVELHVIHLVRDSRLVVSSWSQPKEYLRRHNEFKVAAWWMAHNLAAERLAPIAKSYVRLKYEDAFAALPESISMIQRMAGVEASSEGLFKGDHVHLGTQHTIGGNPDRFENGWVQIRVRKGAGDLPRRRLISLLTWPLLVRYGYAG